ncbi:MAG TPA: Trk system potassium transporter TrkA [Firmicutes bacterium]|nr:Trk system potassium transporter TrkA [Bacillota bacterium]
MKIIVVGAGKVGFVLAHMLSLEDHDVVVLDRKEERIATVDERLDVEAVLGSCTSTAVLKEAGIEEADMLLAVTERDELNIVACFIAKSFGVKTTVARVRSPEFVDIDQETTKKALGIDLIINPERVAAHQIAKTVDYPDALNVEFYGDGRVVLLEFRIGETSSVANRQLKDIKTDHSYLIVGIVRDGNMIIPGGEDYIKENDFLFLITTVNKMDEVEQTFGQSRKKAQNIIIVGGDTISYYLASELEAKGLNIKIFEEDFEQCKILSERLNDALIIHGDATDLQLLRDENVEESDLFAAITDDDHFNVLSAVLAKQLGAPRTVAQLKMSDYIPLVEKIGIDQSISPRILAAGAIMKYVRLSNIVSVTLIGDANAQVLEIEAPQKSHHINVPLMELEFPKNAILGTIIRGDDIIIPKGSDVILPGDRMIIFTLPEASRAAEKFFQNN